MKIYLTTEELKTKFGLLKIDDENINDEDIKYYIKRGSSRVDTILHRFIEKAIQQGTYTQEPDNSLIITPATFTGDELLEEKSRLEAIKEAIGIFAKFGIDTGWDFLTASFSTSIGSQGQSEQIDFESSLKSVELQVKELLANYDFKNVLFVVGKIRNKRSLSSELIETEDFKDSGERPLNLNNILTRLQSQKWLQDNKVFIQDNPETSAKWIKISKDIADLQAKDIKQDEVDTHTSQTILKLQAKDLELTNKATELQLKQTELKAKQVDLQNKINTNKVEIANIKTKLASDKTLTDGEIAKLKSTLTTLTSDVATAKTNTRVNLKDNALNIIAIRQVNTKIRKNQQDIANLPTQSASTSTIDKSVYSFTNKTKGDIYTDFYPFALATSIIFKNVSVTASNSSNGNQMSLHNYPTVIGKVVSKDDTKIVILMTSYSTISNTTDMFILVGKKDDTSHTKIFVRPNKDITKMLNQSVINWGALQEVMEKMGKGFDGKLKETEQNATINANTLLKDHKQELGIDTDNKVHKSFLALGLSDDELERIYHSNNSATSIYGIFNSIVAELRTDKYWDTDIGTNLKHFIVQGNLNNGTPLFQDVFKRDILNTLLRNSDMAIMNSYFGTPSNDQTLNIVFKKNNHWIELYFFNKDFTRGWKTSINNLNGNWDDAIIVVIPILLNIYKSLYAKHFKHKESLSATNTHITTDDGVKTLQEWKGKGARLLNRSLWNRSMDQQVKSIYNDDSYIESITYDNTGHAKIGDVFKITLKEDLKPNTKLQIRLNMVANTSRNFDISMEQFDDLVVSTSQLRTSATSLVSTLNSSLKGWLVKSLNMTQNTDLVFDIWMPDNTVQISTTSKRYPKIPNDLATLLAPVQPLKLENTSVIYRTSTGNAILKELTFRFKNSWKPDIQGIDIEVWEIVKGENPSV